MCVSIMAKALHGLWAACINVSGAVKLAMRESVIK
jgi:hypothetical protein